VLPYDSITNTLCATSLFQLLPAVCGNIGGPGPCGSLKRKMRYMCRTAAADSHASYNGSLHGFEELGPKTPPLGPILWPRAKCEDAKEEYRDCCQTQGPCIP
jgi:hypothetical protein